jgi:hypothetical protein
VAGPILGIDFLKKSKVNVAPKTDPSLFFHKTLYCIFDLFLFAVPTLVISGVFTRNFLSAKNATATLKKKKALKK